MKTLAVAPKILYQRHPERATRKNQHSGESTAYSRRGGKVSVGPPMATATPYANSPCNATLPVSQSSGCESHCRKSGGWGTRFLGVAQAGFLQITVHGHVMRARGSRSSAMQVIRDRSPWLVGTARAHGSRKGWMGSDQYAWRDRQTVADLPSSSSHVGNGIHYDGSVALSNGPIPEAPNQVQGSTGRP
ncbi:hypothetical protein VTK73DRAFT_1639 [Phialemonium thermophilum]|uniref:Uncharacterized protein n=1 Tax=Phialemonium thermophilum TaxID=223376 RepID=A0ABR3VTD2_9PEZI